MCVCVCICKEKSVDVFNDKEKEKKGKRRKEKKTEKVSKSLEDLITYPDRSQLSVPSYKIAFSFLTLVKEIKNLQEGFALIWDWDAI